jgi:acetoin utilization deacetylase AcuC-like enzyme
MYRHVHRRLMGALARPPPAPLFFNDTYQVVLPGTHSFPMAKYRYVREALQKELQSSAATFSESPLCSVDDLCTVHDPEYVRRFLNGELTRMENRRIGFPWSPESVDRALSSTGGTVAATHAVCQPGDMTPRFSGHIAGGTHHAFPDRGEGFCVFSDIAVAARVALRDYTTSVRQILIVDLDVHQGNGNAEIFANEPRVFTFSLQCEGNFFSKREQSDLDVDLPVGAGDAAYLAALAEHLPPLFERLQPDLTFFQAGVDPHEADRFGKLEVSSAGLKRRNKLVLDLAAQHRSRCVLTMGGGYPKDLDPKSRPFSQVVQAHLDCYRLLTSRHARLSWDEPWPWAQ